MVYRTSPVVPDRISLGAHEFTARAINAAGVIGEDQFAWNVSNLQMQQVEYNSKKELLRHSPYFTSVYQEQYERCLTI
jgi:hypothetical protein